MNDIGALSLLIVVIGVRFKDGGRGVSRLVGRGVANLAVIVRQEHGGVSTITIRVDVITFSNYIFLIRVFTQTLNLCIFPCREYRRFTVNQHRGVESLRFVSNSEHMERFGHGVVLVVEGGGCQGLTESGIGRRFRLSVSKGLTVVMPFGSVEESLFITAG